MGRRWCIIDVSNRAHAAFHTTGALSNNGESTGVLFGFLRDLRRYAEEFATNDFVFAFDGPQGKGHRELSFPFYKEPRRKRTFTDAEETARDGLREQIRALRDRILPELGYGNTFHAPGYEADDLIASVVANLPPGDMAVIVSTDKDLYQLLSRRVDIAVRGGFLTRHDFAAVYGVHPSQWPEVKAIAGEGPDGDNIPGVDGVGEATAAKWIRGELGAGKKRTDIETFVKTMHYDINLALVTLPWPGCPECRPEPDAPADPAVWDRVCDRLGFATLRNERTRGPVRTGERT